MIDRDHQFKALNPSHHIFNIFFGFNEVDHVQKSNKNVVLFFILAEKAIFYVLFLVNKSKNLINLIDMIFILIAIAKQKVHY